MQFQKITIGTTLAMLALTTQQHAAIAIPSAPHASTKYEAILQQLGLQTAQPQTIHSQATQLQPQKSTIGSTNQSSASHASTKYDVILQQLGLQTAQPQTVQSQAILSQITQSQTTPLQSQKSVTTDQAGQSFFSHPPQLIRTAASQVGANVPSTYEFTLSIPKDAGQPLKAVTIAQATNAETVKFDVANNKAFIGGRFAGGPEIRLASVGGEQPANPGETTVVFDQPVQPGNTVTIALAAQKNPYSSGVYQFGVTAYPDGENGLGQFLGYGRINFYGNSN